MYFQFKNEHRGERYFKKISIWEYVQVCVSAGKPKKGKQSCVGIYRVTYSTVIGNYSKTQDFKPCTEEQYSDAFISVLKLLNP